MIKDLHRRIHGDGLLVVAHVAGNQGDSAELAPVVRCNLQRNHRLAGYQRVEEVLPPRDQLVDEGDEGGVRHYRCFDSSFHSS